MSRSPASSINMSLIFHVHDLKEALFLKISFLFHALSSLSLSIVIFPFATIYATLYSHKYKLNFEVLNLIFSVILIWVGFLGFVLRWGVKLPPV